MAPTVRPSTVFGQNWWIRFENWMRVSPDVIGGAGAPPIEFVDAVRGYPEMGARPLITPLCTL